MKKKIFFLPFNRIKTFLFCCFILLACFISKTANARQEIRTNSINGAAIATNSYVITSDPLFPTSFNANWQSINNITSQRVTNYISLRFDESSNLLPASTFTCAVTVQITYTTAIGNVNSLTPQKLSLDFSNASTGTSLHIDKYAHSFTGGHVVNVQVTNVEHNLASPPLNLVLENKMVIERYFLFQPWTPPSNVPPAFTIAPPNANNEIVVSWLPFPGAEAYDLEWLSVNDYDGESLTGSVSANNIDYDFANNATRVRVTATTYTVSNVFEKGYVLFRYRAVGKGGVGNKTDIEGDWSCACELLECTCKGKVGYYPAKISITGAHTADKINWNYNAAYAEQGKKKETVDYMDGTQRSRQTVSKLNTDNQTIVGESIYDNEGRPAVNVLPTPSGVAEIKYYPNYNRNNTGNPYNRKDFDVSSGTCNVFSSPLSPTSGSSKYYSPNPVITGLQSYVPDASGYPFTQIEYTPDNTGRIKRQSGLGEDMRLGSNHEIMYKYGKPLQEQLDRLFGSEVGDFSHYKKNVVRDANGQLSVTYLDQFGRTIATSLAGNNPPSLQSIATGTTSITSNILDNKAVLPGDKSLNSQFVYVAVTEGPHVFNYGVTAEAYNDITCLGEAICMDCVYDLQLSVKDECGQELALVDGQPIFKTVGTLSNLICDAPKANGNTSFTISLQPGTYYITKTLTVNQQALNYYIDQYIEKNTCIKTLQEFIEEQKLLTDFTSCDPQDCYSVCEKQLGTFEQYEDKNPGTTMVEYQRIIRECEFGCNFPDPSTSTRAVLIADMGIGGQYGEMTPPDAEGNIQPKDVTSIFHEDNIFGFDWSLAHTFYNEDGRPAEILLPDGSIMYPYELIQDHNYKKFAEVWNPFWATSLVTEHPEIYHQGWNEIFERGYISAKYDFLMRSTETYEEALRLGLLNPLGLADAPVPVPGLGVTDRLPLKEGTYYVDPYFTFGLGGASQLTEMSTYMRDMKVSTTDGLYFVQGMWKIAATSAVCNTGTDLEKRTCAENIGSYKFFPMGDVDLCNADRVWKTFRALYQAKKMELVERAQFAYATANGHSNSHIGIHDGSLMGEKIKRFPKTTESLAASGLTNLWNTDPLLKDVSKKEANDAIAAKCDEQCRLYAESWMEKFKGCSATPAVLNELKEKLIAVCKQGCDKDYSIGASTVNPDSLGVPSGKGDGVKYRSFDDVIKGVIGNTSELCNADMISMPMPYGHTFSSMTLSGNLDTCACNKVLEVESLYQVLRILGVFPGITRKIVAEGIYKLTLDELDAKICECKSAYALVSAGSWVPGAEWNESAASFLANSEQKVPASITCDRCVNCDFITTKANQYRLSYESNNGPITSANKYHYEILLANHLNAENNLDLTRSDYLAFLANCDAAESSCKLTPQAPELEKLFKLLVKTNMNLLDTACLCEKPYSVLDPLLKPKSNFSYTDLLIKNVDPAFVLGSSVCDHIYRFDHITGNTLFGQIKSTGTPSKNCQLQLAFPTVGFAFSDIVEFKNLRADGNNSGTHFTFLIDAHIISKTKETWVTLNGQSSCFPIYKCSGGNDGLLLCSPKSELPESDCVDKLMDQAIFNAKELYKEYITEVKKDFEAAYVAKCLSAASNEYFTMQYADGEYHFTLHYYDQAGNLVRTVPPAGVELVPIADLDKIKNDRKNNTRTYFTKHRMSTLYAYNGLNQLIAQSVPDHENINEWKVSSLSGSLPPGTEITDIGFNPNFTYMFTADPTDPLKSRIYYRSEGSSNWVEQRNIAIAGLKDVTYFSGSGIYAVGDKGALLKSADGNTWAIKTTSISDDIVNVNFISTTEGFVFTKSGKVYRTTDAADSWTLVSGAGLELHEVNEVSFTGTLEGVAVGTKDANGAIFRTSNGGATWTANNAFVSTDLKFIQYLGTDGTVVFAAGINGTLLKSTDGGNTWIAIPSGITASFKKIHFLNEMIGCAIADGKIWYTDNGGYVWSECVQPVAGDEYVDFSFVNYTGYALSKKGYIQNTINAGKSWLQHYKHNVAQDLNTIGLLDIYQCYVAGNSGTLLITGNILSGSWTNVATGIPTKSFKEIRFNADMSESCALMSDGTIYRGLTSGTYWWNVTPAGNYTSMVFINDYTGYALATDGNLAYTSNRGSNWTVISPSSGVSGATKLAIANPAVWSLAYTDALVIGNAGKIAKLPRGAASWEDVSYSVKPPVLNGASIVNSSTAYAAGIGGTLLRTVNGGATWNFINSGTGNDLNDVGITGNNGVLIGNSGLIRSSSTINLAAPTWTVTSVAGASGNHQRVLLNGSTGYITSSDGKILKSINSGLTWASYYGGPDPLHGVYLATASNGFFVGNNGAIVKMTAGTAVLLGTEIRPSRILDSYQAGSIVYAVGIDRTVLRSDNGGSSWSTVTIPSSVPATTDLRGVMFTETSSVIIVGDGVVVRKKESESSWTVVTVPANLEDVYVIDDNNMYAVGDAGTVYRSTNGGANWSLVTISPAIPSVNLKSIYIVSSVGYAVGTNGAILKSDNVMAPSPNWQSLKAPNNDDWTKYTRPDHVTVTLNDVYFTDLTTGYAVGNSGTLLKTINGGKSWELKQSNTSSDLLSITNSYENHILVLGKGSVLNDIGDNSDYFSTRFYYDKLGRMVASQNSKQFAMAIPRYSYTMYDQQNRIIEVGEVEDPLGNFNEVSVNQADFPKNLNPSDIKKYYVTRTIYDKPYSKTISGLFGPNGQENLRNRISTVLTWEVYGLGNFYDHATHYSYDVHGNVKSIIQDSPTMRQ